MRETFDLLLQQMPWAKGVLAWLFIGGLILVLASVPSYLLFLPIARCLRGQLGNLAAWLKVRHEQQSQARERRLSEAFDSYANDHLLVHWATSAKTYWARTYSESVRTAKQVR